MDIRSNALHTYIKLPVNKILKEDIKLREKQVEGYLEKLGKSGSRCILSTWYRCMNFSKTKLYTQKAIQQD